ncbi:lysophospholipid acyltransferase family protein [Rehaibacterium terrae]|jgi:1-acyl-sn-glycerol-3-phosphate acyltransferase|uniref:1-acyl-sn-glycerol-3-phosphate acyltransferase n=1 Tax=Rehaibacterium terrae TaxID=1341696 RepID=A0A7W8DF75_9GAMM|nr:lysophospholipid acyltransferase family protein [Rehaibacterium terrae]MBB5016156.1 1-acyl-sn-glycerol-3-phosphate acyltransferase [Rehaibacterium terrae]
MGADILIPLPPSAPRTGHAFGRWLGRTVLRLGGWKVVGEFPDLPKLMIIAAPHSSGWDAVWGLAAKLALGVDVKFMAKAELFRGPLGWLLRRLGIFPVDRAAPGGIVGEVAAKYRQSERLWLGVAPEGTRRRVERWKSGFWRIAREAGVPVLCAYFHYPEKTIGVGALFELGDDLEADMARIRAWYRPWVGKHRGTI